MIVISKKKPTDKNRTNIPGANASGRDSGDLRHQLLQRVAQRDQQVKMVNKFLEEAHEQLDELRDFKTKSIMDQIRSIVKKLPPHVKNQIVKNGRIKDLQTELEREVKSPQCKRQSLLSKRKPMGKKVRRHLI